MSSHGCVRYYRLALATNSESPVARAYLKQTLEETKYLSPHIYGSILTLFVGPISRELEMSQYIRNLASHGRAPRASEGPNTTTRPHQGKFLKGPTVFLFTHSVSLIHLPQTSSHMLYPCIAVTCAGCSSTTEISTSHVIPFSHVFARSSAQIFVSMLPPPVHAKSFHIILTWYISLVGILRVVPDRIEIQILGTLRHVKVNNREIQRSPRLSAENASERRNPRARENSE